MQQSPVIEEQRSDEQVVDDQPVCRHRWRIDAPNGATSLGICRVCGAEREFSNSSSDSIWENENSDGGNRWRSRGRGVTAVADVPAANAAPAPISETALGSLLGIGFRSRSE